MLEETIKIESSPISELKNSFLITLDGDLDSSNAQDLIKFVQKITDNKGIVHLVVDFSKLRYINSTGLGAILRLTKMLNASKGSFKIASPNENVFEIIEIVGANKLLDVYQTKDEAIASLKK